MIAGLFRAIALVIGLILVLGGGACAVVGVPTFLSTLVSGSFQAAVPIFFATAVGIIILMLGLRMLKFSGGKSRPAGKDPLAKTASDDS